MMTQCKGYGDRNDNWRCNYQDEIERLRNDYILKDAECGGALSQMMDLQQDCIDLRAKLQAATEAKARVERLLAYNGCEGKCAHGACCVEKTCEECRMKDEHDWCFPCLVSAALEAIKETK